MLSDHDIACDVFVSASEQHLRHLTRDTARTYPKLVAVGGDTTFSIVVGELLRGASPPPAIGMIGTGSANDIARSLGVLEWRQACAAVKRGRTTAMDVGSIKIDRKPEPRFFLGTLSAGLAPAVNRHVERFHRDHGVISRIRPLRHVLPGLLGIRKFFAEHRQRLDLRVEYTAVAGMPVVRNLQFSLLVVLNTPHYANGLKLGADKSWSDGILDVYTIDTRGLWDTLVLTSKMRKGTHRRSPRVESIPTPHFRAHGYPMDLLADGDLIEAVSEFEVSVITDRIRVFAA